MNSFFESLTIPKQPSRALLTKEATKLISRRQTRRGQKNKSKCAKWKKEYDEAMLEHKRAKKIPSMTYRIYIGSAYWKKRKNDYFKKYGKQCAVCGQKVGVTLHHKKYDNSLNGKEPDSFFVALCPRHHHEFHVNHELKQNMQKETNIYVASAKQFNQSNLDDLSWII